MYDYVVVGAGLSGATVARRLAEEGGLRVLVVDRRHHVAGNLYDHLDSHGIRVQDYGPHAFHTKDERAARFLQRFCEAEPYQLKCASVVDGVTTPSPFNFTTIDQFYPADEAAALKQRLLDHYQAPQATVLEMLTCDDEAIRAYAGFLFEGDYRPYTAKQWGIDPATIDPSVLKRVPVVFSYRDTYFDDEWQFVPKRGYTAMIEEMLSVEGLDVRLGVDARDLLEADRASGAVLWDGRQAKVVYTGALDELFGWELGALPYRSLRFEWEDVPTASYQGEAIVAYPLAQGYTRITEYTKLPCQDGGGWTSIAREYPASYQHGAKVGGEPYYPIPTAESLALYESYLKLASAFEDLTLCGRLADFKYYNMDQAVLRALEVSDYLLVKARR